MMRCRDFVAFRYAVLLFVDSVNVWHGDVKILRLCDLTLLWFVDFDIWRRSEFVTLGLHMFIFLRLCIFAIREVVIYRNSISAISRVCFFQSLFFCECSNRHFGNIAILWFLRFCGLELQAWCIWPCESVLHDKRIAIVKWSRPINVGKVAWTRKLHSPSTLLLELWQHW